MNIVSRREIKSVAKTYTLTPVGAPRTALAVFFLRVPPIPRSQLSGTPGTDLIVLCFGRGKVRDLRRWLATMQTTTNQLSMRWPVGLVA